MKKPKFLIGNPLPAGDELVFNIKLPAMYILSIFRQYLSKNKDIDSLRKRVDERLNRRLHNMLSTIFTGEQIYSLVWEQIPYQVTLVEESYLEFLEDSDALAVGHFNKDGKSFPILFEYVPYQIPEFVYEHYGILEKA